MQNPQYSEQDLYFLNVVINVCSVWRYSIHYKPIVQQPTKKEDF